LRTCARERSDPNELSPRMLGEPPPLTLVCVRLLRRYAWDSTARCRWGASDVDRVVLERKNDHRCIVYQCKRGTHGKGLNLRPRDGVIENLWRKTSGNSIIFVASPTYHPARAPVDDIVRARACDAGGETVLLLRPAFLGSRESTAASAAAPGVPGLANRETCCCCVSPIVPGLAHEQREELLLRLLHRSWARSHKEVLLLRPRCPPPTPPKRPPSHSSSTLARRCAPNRPLH
jgi:hypothetical protein